MVNFRLIYKVLGSLLFLLSTLLFVCAGIAFFYPPPEGSMARRRLSAR
jgi:hypothetical protein